MKILHLEDNPDDAELVRELVLEEWPDCVITQVATRAAFVSEVGPDRYDLILSDFSLPAMNGLSLQERLFQKLSCAEAACNRITAEAHESA